MNVRRSILCALLMAACILYVFVSPALNLPQTTLRAQQHALRVLMAIVIVAFALFLVVALRFTASELPVPLQFAQSLVDLTCTRRC